MPDTGLTKREFLKLCLHGAFTSSLACFSGFSANAFAQSPQKGLIKTALSPYFTRFSDGDVRCELCPRLCRIPKGERGGCRVRENRNGKCYSLVYGNPCALHPDPIERNPFFHVLPSTRCLSLATAGCNFSCKFCQTWEISQAAPEDVYSLDVPPDMVVKRAKQMGVHSITYTYVEPVIFFEYMAEVGDRARKAGLLSLIHSNGYINPKPLKDLCRVLDAANIDLKSISEKYYREMCGGELAPVLETLKILKQENIHLEITNLVVPTKNDDPGRINEMCLWIKENLGPDTPVHFLRFYPLYKLKNLPPTPASTLENARNTAMSAGLNFVYINNVPGHAGENTFCPQCRKIVIKRLGFMVEEVHINEGKCNFCGRLIPGIWKLGDAAL